MKRTVFLFLALLFAVQSNAQKALREYKRSVKAQSEYLQDGVQGRSPSSYLSEFERLATEGESLIKQGYDIVLPPLESINFAASFADVNAGSWGETHLGINRRYKDIYDRAQRKVVVFVFDTGAWNHPELEPFSWHEKDRMFTGEENNTDLHSHSTHCAGIVTGADGDGSDPLAAKGFLKIISYKVLQNNGSGMFSWIETAIKEANKEAATLMDQGYFVAYSFSLGGGTSIVPGTDAELKAAKELGVYIAASSGNTGQDGVGYPGGSEHVHAVGALQQDGSGVKKASYSTWGDELDISEPGSNILSTVLNGGYAFKSGTSMAAPHQVRVAAMVASIYPELNALGVSNHLLTHAVDIPPVGWDKQTGYGWGIVDKLLDNKPSDNPPPPPPDPDPDPDPEPPMVKPSRMYRAEFPTKKPTYAINYYITDEPGKPKHTLNFRITVEAESKIMMGSFAETLELLTDFHFKGRTYGLFANADFWDAGYWVAYFYDLLEGKNIAKLRVIRMEIFDEKGNTAILDETKLKNLEGLSRLFIPGKRELKKLNTNFFN
jgi:hypothetical protein